MRKKVAQAIERRRNHEEAQSKHFAWSRRYCAIFVLLFICTGCDLESDAKLKDIFEKNTADFKQLADMSEQDHHIQRIDFSHTTLDTGAPWSQNVQGFSEQRWEEYRKLFRKLGLQAGIGRTDTVPPVVFFYAQCEGTAITRDCKGYAYSEKALTPTKDSLDTLRPGIVFMPLIKNWYLFRDGD
jgi:hypothetical protein